MIEAVRLGARSSGCALFEGLDFAVNDGEFWLVTGLPSCGKTILARVLRGDLRPDVGDVFADGKAVYLDRQARETFRATSGLVRESLVFPAGPTVGGLFDLAAVATGGLSPQARREREAELLALVGLPEASARDAQSLSTSERARVALAVELFRGPRALFADRLLENAGFDWAERIVALFRALAKEGRTVMAFERTGIERWVTEREEPVARGPFRMSRFAAAGGTVR